jgi:CMP-N,N'-diacetyllegionaminic acid synthase
MTTRRVLAVVGARGGSKGVPGKNLLDFGGTPLVGRTIAQAARLFQMVAISTDDREISEVALRYGATHDVRRPAQLATDEAPKVPAIRHAVRTVEQEEGIQFDVVVDLDATCPLRDDIDVRGALAEYEAHPQCENVISVCRSRKNPYFNQVEQDDSGATHLVGRRDSPPLRRQDAPEVYDINGAVYVWNRSALDDGDQVVRPGTRLYVMPPERSVDIDGPVDLLVAQILLGSDGPR